MIEAGFPDELVDRADEVTEFIMKGLYAPMLEQDHSVAEHFSAALLAADLSSEFGINPGAMLRNMLVAAGAYT